MYIKKLKNRRFKMGEIIKVDFNTNSDETSSEPIANYTQHASEGKEYKNYRYTDIREIAKIIRKRLKKDCPKCKFSVTISRYAGGQSMDISLMSGPFDGFNSKNKDRGHAQINQYSLEDSKDSILSKEALEIMIKAYKIANSYNYDDSDSMIDYFDTNFYLHLNIGKWDKDFINNKEI